MGALIHRLKRGILNRIKATFLSPIHVFVFHHVSDVRDPLVSGKPDWTPSDVFYANMLKLKKEFTFISLDTAYSKLKNDRIRKKKYAVLTTDDGLQTVLSVWPWLQEQGLPLTCFINAKYLDGVSYKIQDAERIRREDPEADIHAVIARQYMSDEQVFLLNSPLISIASHGYEHLDESSLEESSFRDNIQESIKVLSSHPRYIPFHAFPWGKHNQMTDQVLKEIGLIPVLADGISENFSPQIIHRKCIDGLSL